MSDETRDLRCTVSGQSPSAPAGSPVPNLETKPDGQHVDHWVLCDAERAKGFVRPVRSEYQHVKCGGVTRMPLKCAETYARDPRFYGSTFCCECGGYFPVGAQGEFVWKNSFEKVGT